MSRRAGPDARRPSRVLDSACGCAKRRCTGTAACTLVSWREVRGWRQASMLDELTAAAHAGSAAALAEAQQCPALRRCHLATTRGAGAETAGDRASQPG